MSSFKIVEAPAFQLLPCRPDVCQECAVDHAPEQAHNQQSLYYQYKFYMRERRWPTWLDAIAHCTDDVKEFWIEQLLSRGIQIFPIVRTWGNPELFPENRGTA